MSLLRNSRKPRKAEMPGLSDEAIWNSDAVKAAQGTLGTMKRLSRVMIVKSSTFGPATGEACYVPRPEDEDIVPRAFAQEKEKRSKDQLLIEAYSLTPGQIVGLRLQMETYDHDHEFLRANEKPSGLPDPSGNAEKYRVENVAFWTKVCRDRQQGLADFAGTLGFTVNFTWEEPYLLDKDGNLVEVVYSRWPRGRGDDRLLVALVRAQR